MLDKINEKLYNTELKIQKLKNTKYLKEKEQDEINNEILKFKKNLKNTIILTIIGSLFIILSTLGFAFIIKVLTKELFIIIISTLTSVFTLCGIHDIVDDKKILKSNLENIEKYYSDENINKEIIYNIKMKEKLKKELIFLEAKLGLTNKPIKDIHIYNFNNNYEYDSLKVRKKQLKK